MLFVVHLLWAVSLPATWWCSFKVLSVFCHCTRDTFPYTAVVSSLYSRVYASLSDFIIFVAWTCHIEKDFLLSFAWIETFHPIMMVKKHSICSEMTLFALFAGYSTIWESSYLQTGKATESQRSRLVLLTRYEWNH